MIAHLRGRLLEKRPDHVVLETGGVGYAALIPLTTFTRLPPAGAEAALHVHTYVREDQLSLFGFATPGERDLFRCLIEVRGIGPRLALALLSGLEPDALVRALAGGDVTRLSGIPGVGRKTAERLILELKDRLPKALRVVPAGEAAETPTGPAGTDPDDLLSALLNLGFPAARAESAVRLAVQEAPPGTVFEELVRLALRHVAPGR